MKLEDFLKATDAALKTVYERDIDLIGLKANERAIAHRFAVYLESSFEGKDVDCEYNRYGGELGPQQLPGIEKCKEGKEMDWIIPDIIIHARKSRGKENLAVFEIKAGTNLDDCDKLKLQGMTSKNGQFKYDFGMGVEFYSDHCNRFLFIEGKQQGEPVRSDTSQGKAGGKSSEVRAKGLDSKSKAAIEERAHAVALAEAARSKIDDLSPEMAVQRYDFLKSRPIIELSESEYAERLALAERLSQILKGQRK